MIELTAVQFIDGIASALREDFGDNPSTVKTIGELTGAAPATVKKWLAKQNGPGGEMLVKLMAASPSVRRFVDKTTGREDQVAKKEQQLRQALAIMEGEPFGQVVEMLPALQQQTEETERRPAAPIIAGRYREHIMRKATG